MAEQAPTAPEQPMTSAPPPTPGQATPAAETSGQPPSAEARADDDADPMRELLDRLARMQPAIRGVDPNLAQSLDPLILMGADPAMRAQPGFRHQVAYAFQDLEKSGIGRIEVNSDIRREMTLLAGSAPGLENRRMQAVMQEATMINTPTLIRTIRATGTHIGRQADQATPEIQSRIEALENQLRLAPRVASATTAAPAIARDSDTPSSSRQSADRQGEPNGGLPLGRQSGAGTQSAQRPQSSGRPNMNSIFAAMRPRDQGTGAPWDPAPTPMGDRIARHAAMMQDGADHQALQRVEKSGQAALDALQGFSTGEGAAVMNRVREAAHSDPNGMAGVLAEMRDGGRFADLRKQFNTALSNERGVTAAYDKAAEALALYGKHRTSIDEVLARRPDAANLSAKFEQMDAQIGEAASNTPSRRDGKSMLDDIAKQAAELVQRAINAVKSAFSRTPSAGASNGPSPSPG